MWEMTERLSAAKLGHLDIARLFLKISPPTYLGRKLQSLTLRALLLFCSYFRQLTRRIRDTASVIKKFSISVQHVNRKKEPGIPD